MLYGNQYFAILPCISIVLHSLRNPEMRKISFMLTYSKKNLEFLESKFLASPRPLGYPWWESVQAP